MSNEHLSSETIQIGGREYQVPRAVTSAGGAAAEAWLAAQLLDGAPRESLARMSRAELEEEAVRLGLAAEAPQGVEVDDALRALLVLPAEPGAQLVKEDYVRCIEARRANLAALAYIEPAAQEGGSTTDPEGEG
jgi:hypothetical protein